MTAIAGTDASGDGELVAFARDVTGPFLRVRWRQSLQGQAVRGLAVADITGDGRPDLVVGTRTGPASGALELWRNDGTAGRVAFTRIRSLPLEGIPCAVLAVDLGGTPGPDVVVGLRDNDAGRGGRAMVFFCDARTLPSRGSDPSAGRLLGWVPALVSGAFDTGVRPRGAAASPGFAAGVHPASGGGSVFVFVR